MNPAEARAQCESDFIGLIDCVVPFAQERLATAGEFYPFGAVVNALGNVEMFAGYTGDEHPPANELITLLMGAFQHYARAGKARATCLCVDIRTIPPGTNEKVDAIMASVEHVSGEAMNYFLPYGKDESGSVAFGELYGIRAELQVFVRP